MRIFGLALLSILLVACGDDDAAAVDAATTGTVDSSLADGGPADATASFDAAPADANLAEAATAEDLLALCEAQCAYMERCAPPAGENCASSCVDSSPSAEEFLSLFMTTAAECIAELACAAAPSQCTEAGFAAVDPDWADDPLALACHERADECGTFYDSICVLAPAMTTAGRTDLQTCIDGACADVETCLTTAGLR